MRRYRESERRQAGRNFECSGISAVEIFLIGGTCSWSPGRGAGAAPKCRAARRRRMHRGYRLSSAVGFLQYRNSVPALCMIARATRLEVSLCFDPAAIASLECGSGTKVCSVLRGTGKRLTCKGLVMQATGLMKDDTPIGHPFGFLKKSRTRLRILHLRWTRTPIQTSRDIHPGIVADGFAEEHLLGSDRAKNHPHDEQIPSSRQPGDRISSKFNTWCEVVHQPQ